MRQNNLGIACLLEPFPRDISYTARPSAVERILLVKMEVERHDLAQDFSLLLCGPDLSVFPDDWFIDSLPRCNQSHLWTHRSFPFFFHVER